MTLRLPCRGFVLVESLAALTLLSIALAGGALMVVKGLQLERVAGQRTVAAAHARSLAEGLRALARRDGRPLSAIVNPGVAPTCAEVPSDCLVEDEARAVIAAWYRAIETALPDGADGSLAWLAGPPASYVLSLTWPTPRPEFRERLVLVVEP